MTPKPVQTHAKPALHICLWAALLMAALPGWSVAGEKKESVEYETGFYYTVQKGDTLWSLSKKFADNAWEWPEMWKDNDQIPNPHLIYPGERIRIYQKSQVEEMAVAEKPAPAMKKTKAKEPPFFYYSLINRAGFIRKDPVVPQGSIFKVKDDKAMISTHDMVYIKPDAVLNPGEMYTVFRTLEPYRNPDTKEIIGTQHYLTGVLEIEKIEPDYVTARIVKSYRTIEVGDLLMTYQPRSPKVTLTAAAAVSGEILVAEEQEKLIGTNFVAYIDKGANDGIRSGQQYHIFESQDLKVDKAKTTVTDIDFATILVLFTEPTTATVLVTNSEKNISPGAKFHPSSM